MILIDLKSSKNIKGNEYKDISIKRLFRKII